MDRKVLWEERCIRVKRCRDGVFMYHATDQFVGRSLDKYGEFSRGEADFFDQAVRPGMFVLELGANIGVHTVFFAKHVGSSGRVFAFEPQRVIYQMLCGNVALNALDNVIAYHAAVGRETGSITVPLVDYTKLGNFGGVSLGTHDRGEAVRLLAIDSIGLPRCEFVKIDVEGMERQALEGAAQTLRRCQPMLYIENDREEKSAALIEFLFQLGYRLYWHLPALFHPENYFSDRENVFGNVVSINMLGVPRSSSLVVQGLAEITSKDATWRLPTANA